MVLRMGRAGAGGLRGRGRPSGRVGGEPLHNVYDVRGVLDQGRGQGRSVYTSLCDAVHAAAGESLHGEPPSAGCMIHQRLTSPFICTVVWMTETSVEELLHTRLAICWVQNWVTAESLMDGMAPRGGNCIG